MRPTREPYELAVVVDIPATPGLSDAFVAGLQLGLDHCHEQGVCDRAVELRVHETAGQPWTSARPLERLIDEIADSDALGVAGPMVSDNALAVLPVLERRGLPTISICGSDGFAGRWAFRLSNGSLADEPYVMAAWLAAEGHERIGVFAEAPSRIADEYLAAFRRAADQNALTIAAVEGAPPGSDAATVAAAIERLRDSAVDAVAYLGFGSLFRHLRPALEGAGWDPPRVMTTAFVGATYTERFALMLDGWVGVDQYDERNECLRSVVADLGERGAVAVANSSTSVGYDIGRVYGIALGRMTVANRAGLRDAIETVRRLPAATGAPGTVISFGRDQHAGFSGADYLLLRRAEGGTTRFVGVAPTAN